MRGEYHRKALAILFNERKFKVVAEVGVFYGGLCKYLLEQCQSIKSYYAIDLWEPIKTKGSGTLRKLTKEHWEEAHDSFLKVSEEFQQVHEIRMHSLNAAELFPLGYFDFVFIDADHGYEAVKSDIRAWLPLVREGGCLAGHDFRRKYSGVKKAVQEIFPDSFYILPRKSAVWVHEVNEVLDIRTKSEDKV